MALEIRFLVKTSAVASLLTAYMSSFAGQVYLAGGVPGGVIGWSEPISETFGVRADFGALGTLKRSGMYNDIPYQGTLEFQRAAILADWFFSGRWRLTSGVTFNKGELNLHFQGNNGFVKFNGVSVFAGQADQLDAKFRFPDVSPYIGMGFGLKGGEKGWGFSADVGAFIGQPKMSYIASPSLMLKAGQSNIEQEMASWNAQARKVHAIPQLMMGASYSF